MKRKSIKRATKEKSEKTNDLTKRETEIIQLVYNGYTDKEIAEKLNISIKTASTHRNNILRKLELKNTALLIRYVITHKLVK